MDVEFQTGVKQELSQEFQAFGPRDKSPCGTEISHPSIEGDTVCKIEDEFGSQDESVSGSQMSKQFIQGEPLYKMEEVYVKAEKESNASSSSQLQNIESEHESTGCAPMNHSPIAGEPHSNKEFDIENKDELEEFPDYNYDATVQSNCYICYVVYMSRCRT